MDQEKKSESTYGLKLVAAVGLVVLWVLRNVFKVIGWLVASAIELIERLGAGRNGEQKRVVSKPAGGRSVLDQRDFAQTVAVDNIGQQQSDFKIADRILTIRLEPPVAVLHLRVYSADRVIKRDMIINEPRLRGLLQGRRHELPDISFDPAKGFEEIKEDTVVAAQNLINTKGNMKVKRGQTKVELVRKPQEAPTATKVETPKPAAIEVQKPKAESVHQVDQSPKQKFEPTKTTANPVVPKPAVGTTFEGHLIAAGSQVVRPQGRKPYETFEAKIRLGDGVDVPLRGAELERELERIGVKLGERVAITAMGKVPVTLPSGEERYKNVYRVERR